MKAKIDGKLLLAAVDLVSVGFSSTTLTRVTLRTNDDGLGNCKVEVWDREATAQVVTPYKGNAGTDLSALVPSAQLDALLKKTGAETLHIDSQQKAFKLRADKTRLTVPKVDETTEPQWTPTDDYPIHMEISKVSLLGLIASPIEDILGASAQIRGFQLATRDNKIELLATDGFRIYRALIQGEAILKAEDASAVLPVKLLRFLKQLDASDLPVGVGLVDSSYLIRAGLGELTFEVHGSNLLHDYPNVEKLLQGKPDHRYEINAHRLKSEIQLHQTLSTDKTSSGVFEFKEAGLLMKTRGSHNQNEVESQIEAGEEFKALEHENDLKVGVRLKYLADSLKFMETLDRAKTASVELGIASASTGLIWIQPSQETREAHPQMDLLSVIAPVNL